MQNDPSSSKGPSPSAEPIDVTEEFLRRWPLPQPDDEGNKEERGRALIVGGSPEMPGAVMLSAIAALRAGAGKLRIATCKSVAPLIAAAIPEARIFALPETPEGGIQPIAAKEIARRANEVNAVAIGPGMLDSSALCRLITDVLPELDGPTVLLDAEAMMALRESPECCHPLGGKVILTPHHGEMAGILSMDLSQIQEDPVQLARESAERFRAVVALKGPTTAIAGPGSPVYLNGLGSVGLATSGSGDTLSGIIAGLAARGTEPLQAAVWGSALHALAGNRLSERIGPLGFLARELLAEIPPLMASLRPTSNST